tara:strand:- start:143742 stop:148757 length:5016 start_codon:yes stop_codon:yes gene_type:complete
MHNKSIKIPLIALLLLVSIVGYAQCPKFFDSTDDYVDQPLWKNCTAGAYTMNIVADIDLGPYTINWGDGNTETGVGLAAGSSIYHNYPAGIANYTITITANGCTVTGLFVSELPVKASIQVPPGGVIQVCAPGNMDFLNSSTGNSPNTTYFWEFGDGTTLGVLDASNAGQTITHTYERGTVTCNTRVLLRAQNYCSTTPSEATFEPVQIWDLDDPAISASNDLLCWPDNEVTYTNSTYRNCSKPDEGNTSQRFEYWRFIDFFGPGQDSIIDWRPWPPTTPRTLVYPAVGTYSVELKDSSFCGIVSVIKTIEIIDPPFAVLSADKDSICLGEDVTFTNGTLAPANVFRFNADDGNGWRNFDPSALETINYDTPGIKIIRLAVDVANATLSCKDTAEVQVVVLPNPIADFSFPTQRACNQLTVSFTDESIDAFSYNWNFGNGNTSTQASPGPQTFPSPGKYYVSLEVATVKGCKHTKWDSVEVIQSPMVDFEVPDTCALAEVRFTNTTVEDPEDPIVSWEWDFGDGSLSSAETPNHLYLADGTYIVKLKANGTLCSTEEQKSLRIFPLPNASFTLSPAIGCAPFYVDFFNTSNGATTYFWDLGDGTTSQNIHVNHQYFNNTGAAKDLDVKLVAVSGVGCKDSTTSLVVVNPEISVDFDYVASNNCTDYQVTFQNKSVGSTSYLWDFGDGESSTAENPVHVYTNTGSFTSDFTVVLTVSNDQGCTQTLTKDISVAPEARFGFTASPDSGCSPLNVTFIAKTGAVSYDWLFPDGSTASGVVVNKTFTNPGSIDASFTVKLTAQTSEGCTDVQQKDIVVFPIPKADFSPSPVSGCSPLDVLLVNNSLNANNVQWLFGDGSGLDTTNVNVNHTYINTSGATATFDCRLIVESGFGCKDTVVRQIEVYSGIDAQINQGLAGCSPFVQTFEANGGDTYEWDFGNGQSSTNSTETITYLNSSASASQFYNVQLVAKSLSGCEDTVRGVVEVYPNPIAAFTSNVTSGCSPLLANFTNESIGANKYFWNINGGTVEKSFNPFDTILVNNGSFSDVQNIKLQVQTDKGCISEVDKDITVYPKVTAKFVHDSVACSPFSVPFFNLSINGNSYQWDFGTVGISNESNPRKTFSNSTVDTAFYPLSLIAKSQYGCTDTAYSRVKVLPSPIADFTLSTLASCEPATVDFENISVAADRYQWDFGSGVKEEISDAQFSRTFENPNAFVVQRSILLIATNTGGCVDSMVQVLNLFPRIVAEFQDPNNGCSPLELNLNNISQGYSSSRWDFNGEKVYTSTNAVHTFINTSFVDEAKTIQLIVENNYGCKDTAEFDIVVYAVPNTSFDVSPDLVQRYPASTFSFDNTTPGTWNYVWDFGNGITSTLENPADVTYATWGKYNVMLVANDNECADSVLKIVEVLGPYPEAIFIGGGEDCVPASIAFSDQSNYAVTWLWNFGDGESSSLQNPIHRYRDVGVYSVSLTVRGPNGESDVVSKQDIVVVNPNANASFTFSPEKAHLKSEPIDFINLSLNATSYEWDFGDGITSTEENPSHFYQAVGIYSVQLIADNEFSCPDTVIYTNSIDIFSGGIIEFPNAFTPSNDGNNADGRYNENAIDNNVFFPLYKEVKDYHLQIFTRWGELIFESFDVKIGWNGTINGEAAQQDVYVFKVEGTFEDNNRFEKVGDLTLLR